MKKVIVTGANGFVGYWLIRELQNNGIILAVWESYRCGETEIDYETITSENLTEDLDEVAKERQIKLAEQRRIQEEENKKREVLRKQREYDERKRKYLELVLRENIKENLSSLVQLRDKNLNKDRGITERKI